MDTRRKAGCAQTVVIIGLLIMMIAVCRGSWGYPDPDINDWWDDPIPTESTR